MRLQKEAFSRRRDIFPCTTSINPRIFLLAGEKCYYLSDLWAREPGEHVDSEANHPIHWEGQQKGVGGAHDITDDWKP